MIKPFVWFVKLTGWFPFNCIVRPKYYYEDKKVQGRHIKGRAIVMPNHHSVWDFGTMMLTFSNRTLRCLVAEVIYGKGKLMSWFMKALGSIRVDRDGRDFTFIDKSVKILNEGGIVEIYPEARIPAPGEEKPLEFKTSVAYIALMSGAPIIPVVTTGTYFKKGRLGVLIGKPINCAELCEGITEDRIAVRVVTQKLREKIIELRDELDRRTGRAVSGENGGDSSEKSRKTT